MSFEQAWIIVKNEFRERQHHPIKRRTTAPPRKGKGVLCMSPRKRVQIVR